MSEKILIVDGNPDLQSMFVQFLQSKGYSVVTAGDGNSAVEVARREIPDLIVLDLVLPLGDGFMVMQRLKQLSALSHIPVIALSNTDNENFHRRAIESGAAAFLAKPVKPDLLLKEIQQQLSRKAAPGRAGKKKVLIIDDEPLFRQLLQSYLELDGYDVVEAPDTITAMAAIPREKPDLILLDIGLPGGDGMVVLRRVKANPDWAKIPIIVISGKDPSAYRDRAILAGAVSYFSKPVKSQTLLDSIRTHLNKS